MVLFLWLCELGGDVVLYGMLVVWGWFDIGVIEVDGGLGFGFVEEVLFYVEVGC